MIEAWQPVSQFLQLRERQLAYACRLERIGRATMLPAAEAIEPEELARQVKSEHLFAPILRQIVRSERASAYGVYGVHAVTCTEQRRAAP